MAYESNGMKALLLCGRGANQRALANKLHAVVPLAAIALIEPVPSKLKRRLWPRVASVTLGRPLRRAWFGMMSYYDYRYPDFPSTELSIHQNVNSESVMILVKRIRPDLVIVSGTNLVKQPLIDAISRTGRVINLHTGISPYVKGGPNCTNWCLALAEFDLIGNTVMWLDGGIDSGSLIATEQTPLSGRETIEQIQIAVMEHAHDLYVRCVSHVRNGLQLPSVAQDQLGQGRLFLSKHWTGRQIARAVINYYRYFTPANVARKTELRLISLDEA
jgi:folate-dependent phosphoribosylglycinamide formyltransferase PurN